MTVKEIAEAADTAIAKLFAHFPAGKEALILDDSNILVTGGNAGIGYFTTNHLGYFALTYWLAPLLTQARIVTVGSYVPSRPR